MTWVLLSNLRNLRLMMLEASHLDLSNTPLRRKAWLDEANTLRARWRRLEKQSPEITIVHNTDANRNLRFRKNHALIQKEMLAGTKMKNIWLAHGLPKGNEGTHGRKILDITLTNAPRHRVELMKDDASSDHRPLEMAVLL